MTPERRSELISNSQKDRQKAESGILVISAIAYIMREKPLTGEQRIAFLQSFMPIAVALLTGTLQSARDAIVASVTPAQGIFTQTEIDEIVELLDERIARYV